MAEATRPRINRRSCLAGMTALACRPAFAADHRHAWPARARAAVSLTYDDGYDSQLDHAVPDLSAAGFRGTFFLTVNNIEERLGDWQRVARSGHEIGNHSVSHPCALSSFDGQAYYRREIAPAERFFDQHFGKGPRAFAYPCGFSRMGVGSPNQQRERYLDLVRTNFMAARTVDGGPNDASLVAKRRFLLNAYQPTYDVDQIETAKAYLTAAMAQGRWAILVFHEVLPARKGPGDTSVRIHRSILEWIRTQPLWCAPMGDVFQHIVGPSI